MIEYKNSKGELILNTNFGNGYGIAQRNNKFVVMDMIGGEFEFNKFDNVCKFVATASKWDDSRIPIYNELKLVD